MYPTTYETFGCFIEVYKIAFKEGYWRILISENESHIAIEYSDSSDLPAEHYCEIVYENTNNYNSSDKLDLIELLEVTVKAISKNAEYPLACCRCYLVAMNTLLNISTEG